MNIIPGKRVYIAGPMSGREYFNYPEFFRVEETLAGLGFDVVNPARNDGGETWHEAFRAASERERDWETYMRMDLQALLTCDYVCLLDDWWTSKGATCEQTVAAWLKMPFLFPDGTPLATIQTGVKRS